jgi:16S rRNA A1518/A1519 N6-dimethyltransferase RsmA/KsgA/DIM1 with predicted DNA glycosylase/AP lyase activity
MAHFDYREPKTIILDTSTSYSSFSGGEWQDLSDWINRKCAPRCRIDVIVDSAQSKVQLSMFAPSPKERSALMSLVYEKLPDDVVIMGETNSITEEYARSSFLQAAKAELKLLHKCANKPKGSTLTQMDVANIFAAQSITDEALARIQEQTSIT